MTFSKGYAIMTNKRSVLLIVDFLHSRNVAMKTEDERGRVWRWGDQGFWLLGSFGSFI